LHLEQPESNSNTRKETEMSDGTKTLSAEQQEAFEQIKRLLGEQKVPGAEGATPESTWEDLDADSLDLVELVRALEDEYSIQIEDSELDGVETVGDAVDMLQRLRSEKASG
jgi:acyl carrier protein